MPATKPTAARKLPACAPVVMAEFDLDEAVVVLDEPAPVPVGDCDVVPDADDELEGGVPLAEEALAVAWNASNDLFAVGLTAKTMPDSQWPVCWQENQSGAVELTVTVKEGTCVALAATGWKLESTPPESGWHGAAKDVCVAVWFFG